VAVLPQLKNVDRYRPCDWDLKSDAAGRLYWVDIFRAHVDSLLDAVRQSYPDASPAALSDFRSRYLEALHTILDKPDSFDQITIFTPILMRRRLQVEFGFLDPYKCLKDRENEQALRLAPAILQELHECPDSYRIDLLARNLLAGNLFDMGASAAIEHYRSRNADFLRLRNSLPARPWLVDSLDDWRQRWIHGGGCSHAAFFVDNAGSDIMLGCLPLARWMSLQGARVTLVANTHPALNDVTAPELKLFLYRFAEIDDQTQDLLSTGRIRAIESGGSAALIDLTNLDDKCVRAVSGADLIILQGMGRAIETNYHAEFSCPVLRSAVLKDREIARRLGGKLFDCIFRFVA